MKKLPVSKTGNPRKQDFRFLRYALLSMVAGVVFLFQFSPFLSRVNLDAVNGTAEIYVPHGQEVVFYGDTSDCGIHGRGSGRWEKPWIFEVPRLIEGSWYQPEATVYNRYGAGKSNISEPAGYAEITCSNPNTKIWFTGLNSFGIFTQNTPVGIRFLWAGGAFLLTIMFIGAAVPSLRYLLHSKRK